MFNRVHHIYKLPASAFTCAKPAVVQYHHYGVNFSYLILKDTSVRLKPCLPIPHTTDEVCGAGLPGLGRL